MTKHEQGLRELKKRMDAEFDPSDPDSPDPHLVSWMDPRDSEIWNRLLEEEKAMQMLMKQPSFMYL